MLSLYILIACISIAHSRFIIDDDFAQKQSSGRTYCNVNLTQDHLGWSPAQPSMEWANVTFNVTQSYIQVTPYDANGTSKWGTSAYVIGWSLYPDYSMTMHVNYWGPYINLYYYTSPAPCTRVKPMIRYGKHV